MKVSPRSCSATDERCFLIRGLHRLFVVGALFMRRAQNALLNRSNFVDHTRSNASNAFRISVAFLAAYTPRLQAFRRSTAATWESKLL